jgi:hypothetical protein
MIALYIMGLSTNTSRNALFVDSDRFNHRKDSSDDENCNRNRRKGVSKKVVCYFPIIPHLKCWFAKKESKLLWWHKDKYKQDAGMIRHYADVTQWQNIDLWNPEFAIDPRNIRIAMSTDGMNPFMNSSTHSTWPIVLTILNQGANDFEPSSLVVQQTEIYYDVKTDT